MKRAVAALTALCVLGASLPVSTRVLAQSSDAEKDAARILFTEGKELRDLGKLGPALERFRRAYELAPTPITALEYARTHAMLGHLVEARRIFRSIDGLEKKAAESAKSLAARDEAKQLGDELDKRVPTVVLKITPADALTAASLDGQALDPALLAAPLPVDPGKHVLAVRAKTEGTATFVATEGEHDRVITIELPKPSGDGDEKKPPPKELPKQPAIVGPTQPPGDTPSRDTGASTWPTTFRWVGGIAGGVGLVVGAGAGILALTSASSVKDACVGGVCPPSSHDDLDGTRRWATISTIGFGVVAIGATLFVVGLASEPARGAKKDVASPAVVPYASVLGGGGGLGLSGRF